MGFGMKPDKVPTKEEMLELLRKIEAALPKIRRKVAQGMGHKVDIEGMVILECRDNGIASVNFKESSAKFFTC